MKTKMTILLAGLLFVGCNSSNNNQPAEIKKRKQTITVGVYYFDGWSGKNRHADDPAQPWAKNAPTHFTKRFTEEFADREPIWGWRDDSLDIMERQIDIAAENGVDFFLFCWYWRENNGPINTDAINELPHHTSMNLYLKAKNKHKVKFALLIANHGGSEIKGTENWQEAVLYWTQYFKDPQYVTVSEKPLLVLFGTGDDAINDEQLASMQMTAKEAGFANGLSITGCGGGGKNKTFDYSTHYNIKLPHDGTSKERPYIDLMESNRKAWAGTKLQPYIPIVTVGWDNRPWEGSDGLGQKESWYYTSRTPNLFREYLESAVEWMDDNPTRTTKERIVLLYAWNELGEGGYLVPTKSDPDALYLKQIKNVKENNSK
jgi:hypothetical protein